MPDQCTGLAIRKDGDLTAFGEKLATYHEANSEERVLMGGLSREERAERARSELGIPTECPHDTHDEKAEVCIFHLSRKQKQNLGIDPETVRQAFLNSIRDEEIRSSNKKIFINADIHNLDLQYLDLDSPDNRPIDLRFARLGNLCLNQTVLYEKVRLSHATVEDFECRRSTLLNGFDAEGVTIEETDLKVVKNEFGEVTDFSEARLSNQRASFEDNVFNGDVTFKDADIHVEAPRDVDIDHNDRNISFNGCEFRGSADFSQLDIKSKSSEDYPEEPSVAVKNIKVTFRYCSYLGGDVSYAGANFGSWSDSPRALGATEKPVNKNELSVISFTKSDFTECDVDFSASKFSADIEMPDTDFSQATVDFDNAIVAGDFKITDAKFSEKTIDFYGVEVRGSLEFDHSIFEENKKIRFEECVVRSDAVFDSVTFESKEINFHDFKTENGDLTFENGQLSGNTINFSGIDIGEKLRFERGTIIGQIVDFYDAEVADGCEFESVQIECETLDFSEGVFVGKTDFGFAELQARTAKIIDSEFNGAVTFANSSFQARTLAFDDSIFNHHVTFANAEFRGRVMFKDTRFGGSGINFMQADAEAATLQFIGTRTGSEGGESAGPAVIDFKGAKIPAGEFEQPETPGTYYDFTEATVGDLQLRFHDDNSEVDRLFEYFRFFETEFDGFDFSRSMYREELKENGWRLESVAVKDVVDTSRRNRSRTGDLLSLVGRPLQLFQKLGSRYWRLVREGSNPDAEINELESTYRKAKIGADKQGDSDASSKFFQKELQFRRLSHGQRAWLRKPNGREETPTPWERIRRAWLWITNWILWVTSGYGERPKRVIISSLAVIILFMLSYEIAWVVTGTDRPDQLSGLFGSFTLSAEMFTAIILGGSDVESGPIRMLSYIEGFVGSFFIALFVLTITRSVRR